MDRLRFPLAGALVLMFSFVSCAPNRAALQPEYDYQKVHKICVLPFQGAGGPVTFNEFVREMAGTGIEVINSPVGADAILQGNVTEYKDNTQLIVFLGNTSLVTPGGQTVVVNNPMVSVNGSQATPDGTVPGVRNPQVISIMSTVAVDAHLLDAVTHKVLWTAHDSYEGLDLQGALRVVVETMTQSMAKTIPQMTTKSR